MMLYKPFEDNGERSYSNSCKSMAINNEDIVTHPSIERKLGYDVHACIAKL